MDATINGESRFCDRYFFLLPLPNSVLTFSTNLWLTISGQAEFNQNGYTPDGLLWGELPQNHPTISSCPFQVSEGRLMSFRCRIGVCTRVVHWTWLRGDHMMNGVTSCGDLCAVWIFGHFDVVISHPMCDVTVIFLKRWESQWGVRGQKWEGMDLKIGAGTCATYSAEQETGWRE